jgi:predicted transcriptional regulator
VAKKKALSKEEMARRVAIRQEREEVAQLVASVLRGMRQDKDVKQEQMGHLMARSADVISSMETARTDIAMVDAILWARRLGEDPGELFDRILFFVRKHYAKNI